MPFATSVRDKKAGASGFLLINTVFDYSAQITILLFDHFAADSLPPHAFFAMHVASSLVRARLLRWSVYLDTVDFTFNLRQLFSPDAPAQSSFVDGCHWG